MGAMKESALQNVTGMKEVDPLQTGEYCASETYCEKYIFIRNLNAALTIEFQNVAEQNINSGW